MTYAEIELFAIELFDHSTEDWCLIELLFIHSNTSNHLTFTHANLNC